MKYRKFLPSILPPIFGTKTKIDIFFWQPQKSFEYLIGENLVDKIFCRGKCSSLRHFSSTKTYSSMYNTSFHHFVSLVCILLHQLLSTFDFTWTAFPSFSSIKYPGEMPLLLLEKGSIVKWFERAGLKPSSWYRCNCQFLK